MAFFSGGEESEFRSLRGAVIERSTMGPRVTLGLGSGYSHFNQLELVGLRHGQQN